VQHFIQKKLKKKVLAIDFRLLLAHTVLLCKTNNKTTRNANSMFSIVAMASI